MKRAVFKLTDQDERVKALIPTTDHRILGSWARECAVRVLAYFETERPHDLRPRQALDTLQTWIETGVFKMAVIRKASLDAHAAAREIGADNPARSAARAAGQAVATAHVRQHSIGAAVYALQAIDRAYSPNDATAAIAEEREWQYQRLLELAQGKR